MSLLRLGAQVLVLWAAFNAALPSEDSNTLKGYDMVVAITEPALNQQFEKLWNTPAPPVPGMTGTNYLIRHNLELHAPLSDDRGNYKTNPDGSVKYSKAGIIGYIAPPTIKLNSRKDLSATVSLKFTRGPGNVDSVYKHWVSEEDEDGHWANDTVNGWTLSWDADLSQSRISDPNQLTPLDANVSSIIQNYVKSDTFTVTSIFCLMQSVKIANTLRVTDGQGQPIDGPILTDLIRALIAWFAYELKANGQTNTQNAKVPGNPFILGYGIKQKLAPPAGTPLFIPRTFDISTSMSSTNDVGALNFCIISQSDRVIDMKQDGNAGNFDPSLAKTINLNSFGKDLEADGVMTLSNGLFYNQLLMPYFEKDDTTGILDFSKAVAQANQGKQLQTLTSSDNRVGNTHHKASTWKLDVPAHNTMRQGLAIQERSFYSGENDYSLTWSSTPVPAGGHANTFPRIGTITISSRAHVHYYAQTNTRGGLDSLWSYMEQADMWISLRVVLNVGQDGAGKWLFQMDPDKSFLPKKNPDGTLAVTKSKPATDDALGVYITVHDENYFGTFGGSDLGKDQDQFKKWGTVNIDEVNRRFSQAYNQMQSKVILPAGNVFQFTGMNVDSTGNVFVPLKYRDVKAVQTS